MASGCLKFFDRECCEGVRMHAACIHMPKDKPRLCAGRRASCSRDCMHAHVSEAVLAVRRRAGAMQQV